MNSLLAQYGLTIKVATMAHPVVKGYDGIYKGVADIRLKQLVDWENTMLKSIPPEYGIHSPRPYGWVPSRCADWPVANFYHNAWYAHVAPAVYGNYVYRPFYRSTAWRLLPRTYACVQ